MRQEIDEYEYGFDAWVPDNSTRCFVHILNSSQWEMVTNNPVPGEPPSALTYTGSGLPWFEYYDDKLNAFKRAGKLSGQGSVAAKCVVLGEKPLKQNDPVEPHNIKSLGPTSSKVVDGNW